MAVQYNPAIVTDGLVFCTDVANLKSYPTIGGGLFDILNRNSGFFANGPLYSSSNGGSISFDGTNDYIVFGNSPSMNITTGDFAIEVFFYYERAPSLYGRAVTMGGVYLGPGWQIYAGFDGSSDSTGFFFGRNATEWNNSGNAGYSIISQNRWYHALVTRLNGSISFYLNGVRMGSYVSSYNFDNPGAQLRFASQSNIGEFFKGRIAVYRQYNIGFNSSQVLQNFNALRGRFGI